MPVGELRERMTQDEFVTWSVYYQRLAQEIELEQRKVGALK